MDAGPGAGDLLDPGDLDDIKGRLVIPVVASLLSPEELIDVAVDRRMDPTEVWVHVEALGDDRGSWLIYSEQHPIDWTLGDSAVVLSDGLVDWICETRFGWGQRRQPDYKIRTRKPS